MVDGKPVASPSLYAHDTHPIRNTRGCLFYAWFVPAVVSSMNVANGAMAIAVLTVFTGPLSTDFGWTRLQIAVATSCGAGIGTLIAPFQGEPATSPGAITVRPLPAYDSVGPAARALVCPPNTYV
jgi:hypothetical protein